MHLTPEQQAAVDLCLREKVVIVTGGPGTGKTTTARAIIDAFQERGVRLIACAAPTGKAARRLSERTDQKATTVHRLCYRLESDDDGPGLCLIDEASMLDIELAEQLLVALPDHTHLVFVGDVHQLPSVGPGKVLADLIAAGIPTAHLTQIHRQAAGSQIIHLAHAIHEGQIPTLSNDGGDAFFFDLPDPDRVVEQVVRLVTTAIPEKFGIPTEEIAVICPQYGKSVTSGCGIHRLNTALQAALNPPEYFAKQERRWDLTADRATIPRVLRVGDRLIWTANDYQETGFVNGDETVVKEIWDEEGGRNKVITTIRLKGARKPVSFGSLTAAHGWAMSVHKSQGSE
jgi:exodeoxyribonuclease V alpha subunit